MIGVILTLVECVPSCNKRACLLTLLQKVKVEEFGDRQPSALLPIPLYLLVRWHFIDIGVSVRFLSYLP